MRDFLDDLMSFWQEKRVATSRHKATSLEIDAWEQKHKVFLPSDLREYVTRVNGISGGEYLEFDHESISFLPLSAISTEAEWTEQESQAGMFVFADFLIRSSWWCVALDSSPHEYTQVFFGGGFTANRLIATSLSEFFDLYKNHHSRLYGS